MKNKIFIENLEIYTLQVHEETITNAKEEIMEIWSNIKEKDKSLCRDKAVEAKNDFIAKIIYQNWLL